MLATFIDDIDEHIQYLHVQRKNPSIDFHLHSGCEIYFLISGDVRYFVEKSSYPLSYGDLIITNQHEIHKPSFSSEALYERITVEFNPALVSLFNTSACDLLQPFYNRKNGENNRIAITEEDTEKLLALFHKYAHIRILPSEERKILQLSCFMELLVFISQRFMSCEPAGPNPQRHRKLAPVLDHIEHHLDQDLSLDTMAQQFYISKYYLSKLFKAYTGSTIHEYIIFKRMAAAKRYLSEGCNVTEACSKSGFTDYTSFLRLFKKKFGMLPKDYMKSAHRSDPSSQAFKADLR